MCSQLILSTSSFSCSSVACGHWWLRRLIQDDHVSVDLQYLLVLLISILGKMIQTAIYTICTNLNNWEKNVCLVVQ